jgi:effector-binding domain-containing protein
METITKYEVKEITWRERMFITKRAFVNFDGLKSFFKDTYASLYGTLQRLGVDVNDSPCAIYYSIDETNQVTDVAAAVPVRSVPSGISDMIPVTIPESKVVTATYYGPYDQMTSVYKTMEAYLKEHNLTRAMIIEEYVTDPTIEKDPENWETRIYFILTK